MIAIDALNRGASASERQRLARMLSVSDDDIASSFWVKGGRPDIVTRTVALIGLTGTEPPESPGKWGEVRITAHDMVLVYQYVMNHLPPEDRTLVVDALAQAPQYAADGFDQHFGIPDGLERPVGDQAGLGQQRPCDGAAQHRAGRRELALRRGAADRTSARVGVGSVRGLGHCRGRRVERRDCLLRDGSCSDRLARNGFARSARNGLPGWPPAPGFHASRQDRQFRALGRSAVDSSVGCGQLSLRRAGLSVSCRSVDSGGRRPRLTRLSPTTAMRSSCCAPSRRGRWVGSHVSTAARGASFTRGRSERFARATRPPPPAARRPPAPGIHTTFGHRHFRLRRNGVVHNAVSCPQETLGAAGVVGVLR